MKKGILLIILCILNLPAKGRAATFTVQDGESINEAVRSLSPGDTLLVREGIYRETVTIGRNGTPDNRIIIRNYPGETPILDGTKVITGWTQCTSNEPGLTDLNNDTNPNYANIYKSTIDVSDVDNIDKLMLFENGEFSFICQDPDQSIAAIQGINNYVSFTVADGIEGVTDYLVDVSDLTQIDDYWNGTYVWVWRHHGNNQVVRRKVDDFINADNKIVFDIPLNYPLTLTRSRPDAYALFNHPSLLDKAGEFYHTVTPVKGKYTVYYWPFSGDPSHGDSEITFSVKENAILPGNYVTIDGLEFRGYHGYTILAPWAINGVTVQNCTISNGMATAIRLAGSAGHIVKNNTIHDISNFDSPYGAGRGITLVETSDCEIIKNIVYNTENTSIYLGGSSKILVADNVAGGILGMHGNCFAAYTGTNNVLFARNIAIADSDEECNLFTLNAASNITYWGNVGIRVGPPPNWCIVEWASGTGYLRILNNTLVTMDRTGFKAITTVPGSGMTCDIYNNILDGGGDRDNIDPRDYNIYTGLDWWQTEFYGWHLGTHELDQQGKQSNLYTNYSTNINYGNYNNNLALNSGSPAINAGTDISAYLPVDVFPDFDFSKDLNGYSRIQEGSIDIGAYEYGTDALVDPQDPTNPYGPNDPLDPTDPTNPTDPSDPSNSDDPGTQPFAETIPEIFNLVINNNVIKSGSNSHASIICDLKEAGVLKVIVYDAKGKEIKMLCNEYREAQSYTDITWNATDGSGSAVGSGIYLIHMECGGYKETKKIAVIK